MLSIDDKLQFGRNKGKTVREILKTDPGWLRWIRDEKMKVGENFFTEDVDKLLHQHLRASKDKGGSYLSPRLTETGSTKLKTEMEQVARGKAENELRAELYEDSWGQW